jgi:hypothetical protein
VNLALTKCIKSIRRRVQLVTLICCALLQEVKRKHAKWLWDNRHLRYMWIPHTDAVVVVTNNPLPEGKKAPRNPASYSESEKTTAFQRLLQVWGVLDCRQCDAPSTVFAQLCANRLQTRNGVICCS